MLSARLFRSSAFALLALMARTATALGQQSSPGGNTAPPPPVKMQYDGDAKTGYSATNNDRLLIVRIWVADSQQQRKIMENGLELWVDAKGKKNKTTGIIYPLPLTAHRGGPQDKKENRPESPATGDEQSRPAQSDGHARRPSEKPSILSLLEQQRDIKLVGFGDAVNGVQGQRHPSGIEVGMHMVHDTLYYEAQVPLPLLAGIDNDKPRISIGIIEKGKDPSQFQGIMPGDSPPPGGGEGMGPGGPPPGGSGSGPGGPPGDIDLDQFTNNVIWYKINLYR